MIQYIVIGSWSIVGLAIFLWGYLNKKSSLRIFTKDPFGIFLCGPIAWVMFFFLSYLDGE